MNKSPDGMAANDEAMEDEENRYGNEEEPIESSGQSEEVEVQSGALQPYIQASGEEFNDDMNNQ
jgi:hypothetical protein